MSMIMYMTMYFYQSEKVHFLFKKWDCQDTFDYSLVLGLTLIVGFFIEAVSVFITRLES